MKISFYLLILLTVSASANAQEVIKVSGDEAVINLRIGHGFLENESIGFFDNKNTQVGTGRIETVSPSGQRALVKIQSGTASKNNTHIQSLNGNSPNTKNSDLSDYEKRVKGQSEITAAQHIIGGVVGTYIGFGLGHVVQGRYNDAGAKFTIGEGASAAAIVVGALSCFGSSERYDGDDDDDDCDDNFVLVAGIVGFVGFKIWEIVDVWAGPFSHNSRVREYKAREGIASRWDGFITPTARADGGLAGLRYSF